jgi:hypothetical protein
VRDTAHTTQGWVSGYRQQLGGGRKDRKVKTQYTHRRALFGRAELEKRKVLFVVDLRVENRVAGRRPEVGRNHLLVEEVLHEGFFVLK